MYVHTCVAEVLEASFLSRKGYVHAFGVLDVAVCAVLSECVLSSAWRALSVTGGLGAMQWPNSVKLVY